MVVGHQQRRGKTGENGRGNKRMAVVMQGETGMEALPVKLIGSILSHLAHTRDSVFQELTKHAF